MPFWSLLLRVLLSLSIAFNGVAFAGVSSHAAMHPAAAVEAPATDAKDDMAGSGCPESGMAASQPHASDDCCKSGTCRCPCMHAAQLAVSVAGLVLPAVQNTQDVQIPALGHASPVLGHLIRPPIG
jgi:hypothetical protein